MSSVASAGVVGAGVMGAQIAAHLANAGVPTILLDMPTEGDRSGLARGARDRLLSMKPPPLMTSGVADLVIPGNVEDDLELLAQADWIIEAIVEEASLKRALYRRLDDVRKPGSVVSSNTSTIPLRELTGDATPDFRQAFMITHFFNPPRYMRLLEIVRGPDTDLDGIEMVSRFADRCLGKAVVACNDTPGFIANRIGAYFMHLAINRAVEMGLDVEQVDALLGPALGMPKTGIFGLMDLVGIDLDPKVDASLVALLPSTDAYHADARAADITQWMVEHDLTGRKAGEGFYRLKTTDQGRAREAMDLQQRVYRPFREPALDSLRFAGDPAAIAECSDVGGRFVRLILSRLAMYASSLVPEIADSIDDVDVAMREGYRWTRGPFELTDLVGPGLVAQELRDADLPVPPLLMEAVKAGGFYKTEGGTRVQLTVNESFTPLRTPPGVLRLEDILSASSSVLATAEVDLVDVGDDIACLQIHTKANALGRSTLESMAQALEKSESRFRGLVIAGSTQRFSVGANLMEVASMIERDAPGQLNAFTRLGQDVFGSVRKASVPVVAAVAGQALGGGCELALHCDAVQAYAESYIGLVEVLVGLIPGWGGCTELLGRYLESGVPAMPPMQLFLTLMRGRVSTSAADAKRLGFLRDSDGVTANRDRLLADAKARAVSMSSSYAPPRPQVLSLAGPWGREELLGGLTVLEKEGLLEPHDETVAIELAGILTGGIEASPETSITAQDLLDLEREANARLQATSETRERIKHMLSSKKPLRN